MIERKKTRKIKVGNIFIGGDSRISVQSMLNKSATDVKANVEQAKNLEKAGCELVRFAVTNSDSVHVISKLKENVNIPIVADIQYSGNLAIESVYAGVDAVRVNPGNMDFDSISQVAKVCKVNNIPIRIGVNAGSMPKFSVNGFEEKLNSILELARKTVSFLESLDFENILISLKTSDIETTVRAYEEISSFCDYPLHVGISESGTESSGLIKSCAGIGSLLLQGIGDTIRISLSTDPIKEVAYGIKLLKALGLRDPGVQVVSCPTCGRATINVEHFANEIEKKFENLDKNVKIAVMGCPVNGPGEAKDADFCITGVDGMCLIFKDGKILKKVDENRLLDEISVLINEFA